MEEVGHAADGVAGGFADFDADGSEGEDVAGGDWVGVFEEFAVTDEDLGVWVGIAEGWEGGDVVRVGVGDEDEGWGEPVGGDGGDDGGGVSAGVDDGGVFAGWVEDDGSVDGHVAPCGVEDEEPVEGDWVGLPLVAAEGEEAFGVEAEGGGDESGGGFVDGAGAEGFEFFGGDACLGGEHFRVEAEAALGLADDVFKIVFEGDAHLAGDIGCGGE